MPLDLAIVSDTNGEINKIRPGKLDLLFCISHFRNVHVGGHYYYSLLDKTIYARKSMALQSLKVGVSLLERQ